MNIYTIILKISHFSLKLNTALVFYYRFLFKFCCATTNNGTKNLRQFKVYKFKNMFKVKKKKRFPVIPQA